MSGENSLKHVIVIVKVYQVGKEQVRILSEVITSHNGQQSCDRVREYSLFEDV